MLGSIATLIAMLLMVLLPVLIPAAAAVFHIIARRVQPVSRVIGDAV